MEEFLRLFVLVGSDVIVFATQWLISLVDSCVSGDPAFLFRRKEAASVLGPSW